MKRIKKTFYAIGLVSVLLLSMILGACAPEPTTITNTTTYTSTVTTATTATVTSTVTSITTLTSTQTVTLTPIVVTDDLGVTHYFDEPVDSIVSLAPSNTEIVYFVGAGNKLIGRTDYCNYPEEVSSVESIGGFSTPDKEKVVILDPDVVLATSIHVSGGAVDWLEAHGLEVVVLDPEDLDGIIDDIMMVGEITGNEDIAAEKVAELEDRIDAVKAATSALSESDRLSVLHVTWHDPLWTAGPDTFIGAVIEMAGGTNLFYDISGDVQVDTELAVTRNPQAITVVGSMGGMTDSYDYIVAADSPFAQTDAYINGKVLMIDGDLATRPGPRIVDALELIARFLHPELFP